MVETPLTTSSSTLTKQESGKVEEWFRFFDQDGRFLDSFMAFMNGLIFEYRPLGLEAVFLYTSSVVGDWYLCLIWKDEASWKGVFGDTNTPPSGPGVKVSISMERLSRGRYHAMGVRGMVWSLPPGAIEVRQWTPTNIKIPH